ncbi:hypothetical protein [Catenuloplanes japonicus]|uniref:hypothetical protein n=1 Tax=Catenuloplanes japonicus TaxID=33876 RepID=UPI000526C13B|nr:hypothetical protein [Catenuloplanes japonicus]
MTSNGSLVHDTPVLNGKAGTGRVSEAVAATPEAARKTGEAVRRNPAPVAAAAVVLAGATAVVMRMRAMRKPKTRTQKMRAMMTDMSSRLPSRKPPSMMARLTGRRPSMATQMRNRLGM